MGCNFGLVPNLQIHSSTLHRLIRRVLKPFQENNGHRSFAFCIVLRCLRVPLHLRAMCVSDLRFSAHFPQGAPTNHFSELLPQVNIGNGYTPLLA